MLKSAHLKSSRATSKKNEKGEHGLNELGHTKKVLRFNKKAEAKVMENYFVYLYKDEQKKLVLERFSPMIMLLLLPSWKSKIYVLGILK